MIHVLVIASNAALRIGLRELLNSSDELEVIGEAASLAAWEPLPQPVEVIVVASPISSISYRGMKEVLLADGDQPAILLLGDGSADITELIKLAPRSWGYLREDAQTEELVAAVRALHEGLVVANPELISPWIQAQTILQAENLGGQNTEPLVEGLTPRETEVLQLIAQGLANKQIAVRLGISEHTVKFHISAVFSKLGAANRTEAVRFGTQRGLIVL